MSTVLNPEQQAYFDSLDPWIKARARWVWLTHVANSRGERLAEPRLAQLPPEGEWRWWYFQAGAGSGKTRAAAEWVSDKARRYPGCRVAMVGRRLDDVRQVMCEGESGLLAVVPEACLLGGGRATGWNRNQLEMKFANGSIAKGYSSETPDNLRGPQHHFAWGDEPQDWDDASRGDALGSTFNNLDIRLRLRARPGWPDDFHPQGVMTGTPKPVQLVRDLRRLAIVTRASTFENLGNLDPGYADTVLSKWKGTRLEAQELYGELLEEVEGALIKREWLDVARCKDGDIPGGSWRELTRRLVQIDPSFSGKAGADECGICVGGLGKDGHAYVLADLSGRMSPTEWARVAVGAWQGWDCDAIGYESNLVPAVVVDALRMAAADMGVRTPPRLIDVRAGAGESKTVRLERVSPLVEQSRVHHVGVFPLLESQLCEWTQDLPYSPDRLDSYVHLLGEKMLHAARPPRQGRRLMGAVSEGMGL